MASTILSDYPRDWIVEAPVVVGLVGNSAVHTNLGETMRLSLSRNHDRPFRFLSFESLDRLPRRKAKISTQHQEKRLSTDVSRLGNGILKTAFLQKYQERNPGLIVFFHTIETPSTGAGEEIWRNIEIVLQTYFEKICERVCGEYWKSTASSSSSTASASSSSSSLSAAPGEDPSISVDIKNPPRMIFVVMLSGTFTVPAPDNFLDAKLFRNPKGIFAPEFLLFSDGNISITRLERSIADLCFNFYRDEIRRWKRSKKFSSERNQTADIQIASAIAQFRNRFKMGYFSEIIGDKANSIKYFEQSYEQLQKFSEIFLSQKVISFPNAVPTFISEPEMKLLGEYIMMCKIIKGKMCLVSSDANKPMSIVMTNPASAPASLEASIRHFLNHIQWYSKIPGDNDWIWEHFGLLGRQFRKFGEVMEIFYNAFPHLANPTGDSSRSFHERFFNPGYYFHSSAHYFGITKNSIRDICEPRIPLVEKLKKADPEALTGEAEKRNLFVGQKANFEGLSLSLLQQTKEQVFLASITNAMSLDLSSIILELLNKAYEHFKRSDLSRMIVRIAAEMADEYFQMNKFDVAKRFLDRIARSYRKEKFLSILGTILDKEYQCSLHLPSHKDRLDLILELQSCKLEPSLEKRLRFFDEMMRFAHQDEEMIIDLDEDNWFLQMRCGFSMLMSNVFSLFTLRIMFKNFAPNPVRFSKISVTFSDSTYTQLWTQGQSLVTGLGTTITGASTLDLEVPGARDFDSDPTPILIELPIVVKEKKDFFEVVAISVHLSPSMVFRFKIAGEKIKNFRTLLSQAFSPEKGASEKDPILSEKILIDKIAMIPKTRELFVERPIIRINNPPARLSFNLLHFPPALVGEFYSIVAVLRNPADAERISDGKIWIVPQTEEDKVLIFGDDKLPNSADPIPEKTEFVFGEILPDATLSVRFFVRTFHPGTKNLKIMIAYRIVPNNSGKLAGAGEKVEKIALNLEETFQILGQFPFETNFRIFSTRKSGEAGHNFCLVPQQSVQFSASSAPERSQDLYFSSLRNQPLVIHSSISATTPFPMMLNRIELKVNEKYFKLQGPSNPTALQLQPGQQPSEGQVKGYLEKSDTFSAVHVVTASFPEILAQTADKMEISPGELIVKCKRWNPISDTSDPASQDSKANPPSLNPILFRIPIPPLKFRRPILSVDMDLQPHIGAIGQPMRLTVTVNNRTELVQPISITMCDPLSTAVTSALATSLPTTTTTTTTTGQQTSATTPATISTPSPQNISAPSFPPSSTDSGSGFLLAGPTEISSITVAPHSSRAFHYTLIPLVSGQLLLPQLAVTSKRDGSPLVPADERWHVFVMPDSHV